jgi:hypothetical protein
MKSTIHSVFASDTMFGLVIDWKAEKEFGSITISKDINTGGIFVNPEYISSGNIDKVFVGKILSSLIDSADFDNDINIDY